MGSELELRRVYTPPDDSHAGARRLIVHDPALEIAEGRLADATKSRRRAWFLTWTLIVICAAQAAAIAIMLPLRDVVPYTILVDRQTGYVEAVRGVQTGALREDEALVHSFLAQYVIQRETIDPVDFPNRYERVTLWSAETARSEYVALYAAGSPDSLLDDMRPNETISVRVNEIELLDRSTARVRFTTTRRTPDAAPVEADWQTVASFRFTGAPMRMEDRLINPLGFQVVSYRRDAEGPEVVLAPPEDLQIRGPTAPEAPAGATQVTPAADGAGGAESNGPAGAG